MRRIELVVAGVTSLVLGGGCAGTDEAAAAAPPVDALNVYVASADQDGFALYRVDPSPVGTDVRVGLIVTETGGAYPAITDLAECPDGTLYACSFSALYAVDPGTAKATLVMSGLPTVNALACDASGALFAATAAGQLLTIDPIAQKVFVVGDYGSGVTSAGDLAFAPSGALFAAVGSPTGVSLGGVDRTTGAAWLVNPGAWTGVSMFWALAFERDELYGFVGTSDGKREIWKIDRETGRPTRVRETRVNAWGAG